MQQSKLFFAIIFLGILVLGIAYVSVSQTPASSSLSPTDDKSDQECSAFYDACNSMDYPGGGDCFSVPYCFPREDSDGDGLYDGCFFSHSLCRIETERVFCEEQCRNDDSFCGLLIGDCDLFIPFCEEDPPGSDVCVFDLTSCLDKCNYRGWWGPGHAGGPWA